MGVAPVYRSITRAPVPFALCRGEWRSPERHAQNRHHSKLKNVPPSPLRSVCQFVRVCRFVTPPAPSAGAGPCPPPAHRGRGTSRTSGRRGVMASGCGTGDTPPAWGRSSPGARACASSARPMSFSLAVEACQFLLRPVCRLVGLLVCLPQASQRAPAFVTLWFAFVRPRVHIGAADRTEACAVSLA